MEGAIAVIALVAVVVSAGAITVSAHFRKERSGELRGWAREHGWDYTENHPRPLADAALPRAVQGRNQRAQHVLTGHRGPHLVTAFEVTHTVAPAARRATGQVRHTHRIVAVRTPARGADLEFRRRNLAYTGSSGNPSSPEETDRAFADAFHTVSDDDHFTRAILGHDTALWMLSDPRSRSFPVRFSGGHVLTWASMGLDPDRALTAADYLIDLLDRIPTHAWERNTTGP